MRKFDFETFKANPHLKLIAEYYQKNELLPVTEYEVVMDKLAVKDPFSDWVCLLDSNAETQDVDGNWVATIYMVEDTFTLGALAAKLMKLKPDEEIHFITTSREDGCTIRRLLFWGADIFIARYWESGLSMYDVSRRILDAHDVELWLCDFMVMNPEINIYRIDEKSRIRLNHETFNETYRLVDLRCREEGWLISDAVGMGYRVEADDERRDLCADDEVALQRAKARGIRFRADEPYCPVELIYPHKQ